MLLSMSVTAFAANESSSESAYSFYYRDCEDGIIETPLEGEITVEHHPANDAIDSPGTGRPTYDYVITQTSKWVFEGYYPITNWALGPGVLTYTAEAGSTVSFEVSSTISAGVDVPTYVLNREFGISVGSSTTFTASESVQYEIPSGKKGRIVMYYAQDVFEFKWEKKLANVTVSSGSGEVRSAGRDPYYARQLTSAH